MAPELILESVALLMQRVPGACYADMGSRMDEGIGPAEVEIQADDHGIFNQAFARLRGVPGITVTAVSAPAVPGEQGAALDLLMVTLSSGAVTAFLQIIKAMAESHGPKFSLKIRQGKNRLDLTADNVDEVIPVLRKLMNDQS